MKESLLIISSSHYISQDLIESLTKDPSISWTMLTDESHSERLTSCFEHIVTIDWKFKDQIQKSPLLGDECAAFYILNQINPLIKKNWDQVINLSQRTCFA